MTGDEKAKIMAQDFKPGELVALRDRAQSLASIVTDTNSGWARAYEALADAADRLDAMLVRYNRPS